jgi:hypothetical protein
MVHHDPTYNVCIINCVKTKAKDPLPSPMPEIDRHIYRFATNIDFIIFVCEEKLIMSTFLNSVSLILSNNFFPNL